MVNAFDRPGAAPEVEYGFAGFDVVGEVLLGECGELGAGAFYGVPIAEHLGNTKKVAGEGRVIGKVFDTLGKDTGGFEWLLLHS